MLTLSISGTSDDGMHRAELDWQDGAVGQKAITTFSYDFDAEDTDKIRWYLEDFTEFPFEPSPSIASSTESLMIDIGRELFRLVFSDGDAARIWSMAKNRLSDVRVEVDADLTDLSGLPWELLCEPDSERHVALSSQAFVRTRLHAKASQKLGAPNGDGLRVLLVICRPGGNQDVPFRSVASRLVRGGADRMTGLDLDVLRPPTFGRLSEALRAAADAGRPYHVVHFDGHGAYLDVAHLVDQGNVVYSASEAGGGLPASALRSAISTAGPIRPGRHGYLIFEDPANQTNQQLVDGPTLGRLLKATQVPIVVLNACRSAYAEAPSVPVQGAEQAPKDPVPMDAEGRIRAYGSLAAEVADVGVPGVVAMRYNVHVVTAAQFAADLYAFLLSGKSLGEATTEARRRLAYDAKRYLTAELMPLQDWFVPVVFEATPLLLFSPANSAAPLITLKDSARVVSAQSAIIHDAADNANVQIDLPLPPESGFFGRDETLLAIDRAFDTHQAVLLRAYAGSGKSSTAAEFARWYQGTGGLDYSSHPERRPAPVIWSSFDHYLALDHLLDIVGDSCAGLLEARGILWHTITGRDQRRKVILQLLREIPVLWVWDNVEAVAGFPVGTRSNWSDAEQRELAEFLRDLIQRTQCKVLLTSRRGEHTWLGGMPIRITLPPMPMRESLQLAQGVAVRRGRHAAGVNWRPLLHYAAGNPLTITVLVGLALKENLASTAQIEGLVTRLRAGETALEAVEDVAQGRSRSLAASLDYGLTHAFTDAEREVLALLHLFRSTVYVHTLRVMGMSDILGDDAIPQLSDLTEETCDRLLKDCADSGMLTVVGSGMYTIHPALPWYLATLFTRIYDSHEGDRATRAYTRAVATLADYHLSTTSTNTGEGIFFMMRMEEANISHALTLARASGQWEAAADCLRCLNFLYDRMGRLSEWRQVVNEVAPDFIDPVSDGPLPGRERHWDSITSYRAQLALKAGDRSTATRLQRAIVAYGREYCANLLSADDELTGGQRATLRAFAVSCEHLGYILLEQGDASCLEFCVEALELFQRIGARHEQANLTYLIAMAYRSVPTVRDLGQARRWLNDSLELVERDDVLGRSRRLNELAAVELAQFYDRVDTGAPDSVLQEYITRAFHTLRGAVHIVPTDSLRDASRTHTLFGDLYLITRNTDDALRHYYQALKYAMSDSDRHSAGQVRVKIATILQLEGRFGDGLLYARAGLDDLKRAIPEPPTVERAITEGLITELEHQADIQNETNMEI